MATLQVDASATLGARGAPVPWHPPGAVL